MTTPLRVLLVEDVDDDAALVLRELRRGGYDVVSERVEKASSMREALERRPWDVIVSDWSLPNFSALHALGVMKELALDTPFIIVSGTIGEETAVTALQAGALDFVVKDKLSRLLPAIERELREVESRRARRRAEAELRTSESRYRMLFQNNPQPMWVYDLNTLGFLAVNDAAVLHYGYSRDEFAKMTLEDIRPSEDIQTLRADISRRSNATSVWRHQKKDRSIIVVEIKGHDFDFEGRPSRLILVNDITERYSLEEQLRQAQKMEAVGRLAGGVAHDFNNLLSVILSYGEMLLSEMSPAESMRQDVLEIQKAGKRAASLTRQLLSFSRQQVLEPKVVNLNELLSGVDNMLQRVLGADVEVVSTKATGLGRVCVDPVSIEQVIMNLVVNARDAMPKGGRVTIETANVDLDEEYVREHLLAKRGPHVLLAVSDTGTGMDSATQARIFEPFFTTKPKDKGTGLGLSTVFGIVQQSSGSITVKSEPGKGTTFRIYLPRVDSAVDRVEPPIDPLHARGSETILLVEDEEQVRVVARDILRRHGYEVLEARNAGEAILVSERHAGHIDLLLSDVVMPQMSGPDLAARLTLTRRDMKVLCMSGYAGDAILQLGATGTTIPFLPKPVTPRTLTKKVREVLDEPGSRTESAAVADTSRGIVG